MMRNIRQYGEAIDPRGEAQLKLLAECYASAKNYFGSRYSGPKSLMQLKRHRQNIRDPLMQTDVPETFRLTARYWKLALDESVAGIKSEWANTRNRVRKAAARNPNLSSDEKHYLNFVLRWDVILSAILCHQPFEAPDKLPEIGERTHAIHNLIRRYIRKYHGAAPIAKRKASFMVDSAMYRYRQIDGTLYLEITGIDKGQRIRIKLRDHNRHTGNLRIVLTDQGVVINTAVEVPTMQKRPENRILGIDKGYTSLFATSTDHEYGTDLGKLLSAETERLNEKNRKRNRIWAQINTLELVGDKVKAQRIRDHNFGAIKKNRQNNRFREQAKSCINHGIRQMIKIERPDVVVAEELTFQSWQKKLSKQVKRKLTRWMKGYIQERLNFICELSGIFVLLVNPAYTSQICHHCGSFGKRAGKTFTCPSCGSMDADINAAHNIRDRLTDPKIRLTTSYEKVKLILEKRQPAKPAV
ncbi:MAG: transposase [Acetobacterium sp.]|nr:transposase [Acetobacterium sp.]